MSEAKTLLAFVKDRHLVDCGACQLPSGVRRQLSEASELKITMRDAIEWLKSEHNVTLAETTLRAHLSRRHDDQLVAV